MHLRHAHFVHRETSDKDISVTQEILRVREKKNSERERESGKETRSGRIRIN
jgi:hypothetical protein